MQKYEKKADFPSYKVEDGIIENIKTLSKKFYNVSNVIIAPEAQDEIDKLIALGYDNLPICMAKTPNSLSDKDELIGRPEGFTITVKEIRVSGGAKFLVCLTGAVMTMPGLPKEPLANKIDIDSDYIIKNLS